MNIWMIYDKEDYEKNTIYYDMHVEKGKKYGINFTLILADNVIYGLAPNKKPYILYDDETTGTFAFITLNKVISNTEVKHHDKIIDDETHRPNYDLKTITDTVQLPDAVIMRSRNHKFAKHLELMGVKVYNNSYINEIANNKYKTYELIKEFNATNPDKCIPITETTLIEKANSIDSLSSIKDKENYIIKSTNGHGGTEVYRLNKYLETRSIIKKDMVLQPFVEGPGRDLRVYVLNNKIVAGVMRTAVDGFKANYSQGGDISLYDLSKDEEALVYTVLNILNEKSSSYDIPGIFYGGIDFLINKDSQLVFNEIEDVVGSRMLYHTTDIDIVDMLLQIISSK